MDELHVAHTVPQDREARRFLHRPLVDDGHLIPPGIRKDPGSRGVCTADRSEVGRVDAVFVQSRPVVVWEIVADERRERGLHAQPSGRTCEVAARPTEIPLPIQDLDRGVWLRQPTQGHDVIHHDMAEDPDEVLHADAPRRRCTSANRSNGMKSISSVRHRFASSSFAKTRSASMAGQRSECPFPT